MNIAERYHKNCDAFDNIHCSAVSKHGESMPRTDQERSAMSKNASEELHIAREEGARLGFTNKDGNKQNYKLSNLEWCTSSENMAHAWGTGLQKRKASSGERYIYLCKTTNRWRVIITLQGAKYRIGRFDTVTEAREQRNKFLNDNYDAQSEETKLFIGNLLGV